MKSRRFALAMVAGLLTMAGSAANAVVISGYNVSNASDSGTGRWTHFYTGTITPTAVPGYSDYTLGGGTMADGVKVATSSGNTQLFCEAAVWAGNSAITPTITVFLDNAYNLSSLSIFGGDGRNSIPGAITGVDVTIGGSTVTILSTQFGAAGNSGQLVNDLVTLTGTGLELIATNQVILSNFTYVEQGNTRLGRFSIAEFEFASTTTTAVPERGTLALFGLGILSPGFARRRKQPS